MSSELPARRRPGGPRSVPLRASDNVAYDDILSVLGRQLGEAVPTADPRGRRKLKGVTFEYGDDPRAVHDMAGNTGYSLASNWFTQLLAQLAVANSITKSQLCVFLFVAGGQVPGTGIAQYTQQEITDGLNKLAVQKNGKKITRSTVNRAIKALCEYNWVEKAGNGAIQLNVRLWFQGNSTAQREVLATITSEHGDDLSAFPHNIGPEPHQEEFDFGQAAYTREKRIG
ncbi:replication/maintenance protein RepL [Streptomyces sp. NPDC056227]|uniref:replication/maintenance protein RepL n=1 Tax=unclassified Streptomyces TaxID=2593676 RepID=UPI0035D534AE